MQQDDDPKYNESQIVDTVYVVYNPAISLLRNKENRKVIKQNVFLFHDLHEQTSMSAASATAAVSTAASTHRAATSVCVRPDRSSTGTRKTASVGSEAPCLSGLLAAGLN